jgi:hypothetical protein
LATGVMLGAGIVVAANSARAQQPQNAVQCWAVPNGVNSTVRCANGYWITTTPEGETFTGNGMSDPSASASGSTIVINPATGGPYVGAGTTVVPPTQVLPMLEPYQAQQYGFQPRQD